MSYPNIPDSVPVNPLYANGVGKGWFPLVEELHKRLKALDPEYTVDQIKEKFGGLRFYWEPHSNSEGFSDYDDRATIDKMNLLVDFATQLSYRICEDCGAPGKLRNGGWIRTLCDKHARAQGYAEEH